MLVQEKELAEFGHLADVQTRELETLLLANAL